MKRTRIATITLAAMIAASSTWLLAQDKAPDVSAFDKNYAEMQVQMQAMHEQMGKLAETKDPAERQKLLQEHWASMQATMQTMRGLWGNGPGGPGMMGGGPGMMMGGGRMGGGPGMMNWGNMRGYYQHMSPEQFKQRQYMSDQFMGMQQQMMEQMLQHQQWMFQPPPAAPASGK